jgi:hypothetical protein
MKPARAKSIIALLRLAPRPARGAGLAVGDVEVGAEQHPPQRERDQAVRQREGEDVDQAMRPGSILQPLRGRG